VSELNTVGSWYSLWKSKRPVSVSSDYCGTKKGRQWLVHCRVSGSRPLILQPDDLKIPILTLDLLTCTVQ